MPHELPKYLYDVRQACAALEEFIQGKTFDQYLKDHMLQAAVERKLTIIGEALLKAVKIDPTLDQSVKDLSQIIAFRNVLVHGYASINHKTVWGVLENDLNLLKQQVENLLAKYGPP
jgi:uncharacterized protein with HEPN domain